MKYGTLWVDFAWVLMINFMSGTKLSIRVEGRDEAGNQTLEDRPTGHIFGMLRDILAASEHFDKVVLALEGGKDYRRTIWPSYKSGRPPLPFPIFDDRADILTMLSVLPNVYVAHRKDYEADDL